jgi:phospholipid/cholesterol/gamma-HCH transport system permease protein
MYNLLELLGNEIITFIEEMGLVAQLFGNAIKWLFRPPLRLQHIIAQMEEVGFNSIPVVLITASFTGMVLALQSYIGFKRFSAESLVLTGLMVAGRIGAAMAAELGTMRVTEQIDALVTLGVNPVKYLVVPRLVAGVMMLPLLAILSDILGVTGGYFVSVNMLGANPVVYLRRSTDFLKLNDIYSGLLKAAVFGGIIAIIGCYKGFYAEGGAEGVGKATTGAVVISCMLILITDYFLTALLF